MPPLSEKELEEQLTAAGKSLADPPASLDELLPLLDRVEELLSKVEQSPTKSMQTALSPLMKGLVSEVLLKHSDIEVKVGVASCISEITRITAPEAPYDDEKMKDVFQLIVSSFENLSDVSSKSHEKRATILETVSKVRSCVIMLDLECDQMIIDMFQHFLNTIRAHHAESIFTSMETIMHLVIEESEDVTTDLLAPLLATLRRNNQDVTPIARKLAEKVIEKSADKIRPTLKQAVTSLETVFDDYGEVLASVCGENTDAFGHTDESTLKNQPVVEGKCSSASPARDPVTKVAEDDGEGTNVEDTDSTAVLSPKSVVSNGINETGTNNIKTEANNSKSADSDDQLDANSTFKAESDDCDAQKSMKLETKEEKAKKDTENRDTPDKDVLLSPPEVKSVEADESLDKGGENNVEIVAEASKPVEALNEASPAQSGSHPGESLSETEIKEKEEKKEEKEEKLVGEEMESVDTAPKKASEEESISEIKKQRTSRKKRTDDSADKDKASTKEVAVDDDCAGDSEARTPDRAEKPKDATKTEYGSSERKKDGKKSGHGKHSSEKDAPVSSGKEDNGKNTVTPRKSPLKSTKHEKVQEETPRTSTKRKQTPGKEKASETAKYGKNLVGKKVKVWWPKDHMFYEGVIESFDSVKKKHRVLYVDGDEETLNLRKERWDFLFDDVPNGEQDVEHSSDDTSSDETRQVKRKGNMSSETTSKRQKVEGSPKSKPKSLATKSGGKSKDDAKSESESKENHSKPSKRSADDKSKDQPQKLGAKGQTDSGKASGRSKLDSGKNSKQDSLQTPKTKGKTPPSGKSVGSGGTRATKSSSSKGKETEQMKEKTTEAGKSSETPKGRSTETAKRGRKRRK